MIRFTLIVLILAAAIGALPPCANAHKPCSARTSRRTSGIGGTANCAATDLHVSKAWRDPPKNEDTAWISSITSACSRPVADAF